MGETSSKIQTEKDYAEKKMTWFLEQKMVKGVEGREVEKRGGTLTRDIKGRAISFKIQISSGT